MDGFEKRTRKDQTDCIEVFVAAGGDQTRKIEHEKKVPADQHLAGPLDECKIVERIDESTRGVWDKLW